VIVCLMQGRFDTAVPSTVDFRYGSCAWASRARSMVASSIDVPSSLPEARCTTQLSRVLERFRSGPYAQCQSEIDSGSSPVSVLLKLAYIELK